MRSKINNRINHKKYKSKKGGTNTIPDRTRSFIDNKEKIIDNIARYIFKILNQPYQNVGCNAWRTGDCKANPLYDKRFISLTTQESIVLAINRFFNESSKVEQTNNYELLEHIMKIFDDEILGKDDKFQGKKLFELIGDESNYNIPIGHKVLQMHSSINIFLEKLYNHCCGWVSTYSNFRNEVGKVLAPPMNALSTNSENRDSNILNKALDTYSNFRDEIGKVVAPMNALSTQRTIDRGVQDKWLKSAHKVKAIGTAQSAFLDLFTKIRHDKDRHLYHYLLEYTDPKILIENITKSTERIVSRNMDKIRAGINYIKDVFTQSIEHIYIIIYWFLSAKNSVYDIINKFNGLQNDIIADIKSYSSNKSIDELKDYVRSILTGETFKPIKDSLQIFVATIFSSHIIPKDMFSVDSFDIPGLSEEIDRIYKSYESNHDELNLQMMILFNWTGKYMEPLMVYFIVSMAVSMPLATVGSSVLANIQKQRGNKNAEILVSIFSSCIKQTNNYVNKIISLVSYTIITVICGVTVGLNKWEADGKVKPEDLEEDIKKCIANEYPSELEKVLVGCVTSVYSSVLDMFGNVLDEVAPVAVSNAIQWHPLTYDINNNIYINPPRPVEYVAMPSRTRIELLYANNYFVQTFEWSLTTLPSSIATEFLKIPNMTVYVNQIEVNLNNLVDRIWTTVSSGGHRNLTRKKRRNNKSKNRKRRRKKR